MADDLGIGRGTVLTWHRHGLGLTDLGVQPVTGSTGSRVLENASARLLEDGSVRNEEA